MQTQNMCNCSSVRCAREERLHRVDVQKLKARQMPAQQGPEMSPWMRGRERPGRQQQEESPAPVSAL